MGWPEANQGTVLPKMQRPLEKHASFLGIIFTSYSFVAWTS